MISKGDLLQIVYRNNKDHTFQVLESQFVMQDETHIYLKSGKYRIKNIKGLRNLTEENTIDVNED